MKVIIRSIVGENAVTLEDGQKVYTLIKPVLSTSQPVSLDFSGLTVFASLFFNAAIGQLLKTFRPDELNHLLKVENLSPTGHETLKRSIENAKRYYASEDFRKAQSDVLRAMAED